MNLNYFTASNNFKIRFGNIEFSSLTLDDNTTFTSHITESKIREVVWQCEESKTLQLDKFNFNFIKSSWEFLKYDIIQVTNYYECFGNILRDRNALFITLVPKINDSIRLKQYKPVSLVQALYKIITRVM